MKKHFTSPLTRLLALALLVASGILSPVTAQDLSSELISYPNKVLEQLPAKHRQTANEFIEGKNVTSYLVRINSIKDAVRDNAITLTLPGGEGAVKIVLDRIEYYDEKNYTVAGKVENTLLTALFSSHEGRKGGIIQGFESTYEIFDLEEEGQLLVKSNNSDLQGRYCTTGDVKDQKNPSSSETPVSNGRKSAANARTESCTSNIRVLFLHTSFVSPSAASSYATNAINILNQTISQSGVNNSQAYAEVAGIASLNFTQVYGNDIQQDAIRLSDDPTAQGLRSTYKADLVVLLTYDYYQFSDGGVPHPQTALHPNNSRAYGIVSTNSNPSISTVAAHELSHLYGCNHEDVAFGLSYSKAYQFNALGHQYKTLVANATATGCLILYYSNPNQNYPGTSVAMGASDKNNAQVMSVNASTVKSFQPEPNVMSAYIDGPYSGIAYHMYTFEAVTRCGSAPYSYQWRVSTDGFNYGSVIATGEYFNGNHWHYIKLTVTSADNQTSESVRQVWVEDNNGGYRVGVAETEANADKGFKDGMLYPNPVVSAANLDMELLESGKVMVDVHDVSGVNKASVLNKNMEKGRHRFTIPFHKYALPDGLYFIRVQTPEGVKSHKILYRHENR